jgi:superfamily II DNA/RNA helicase
MKMAITGNYSLSTNLMVRHLAEISSSAFIFFNAQMLIPGVMKHVEGKIDQHPTICADVIQIHGKMEKTLKYININLFTGKLKLPEVILRILVATSASDMGVDHRNTQFVLNCEFPKNLSTVLQRRGRSSRRGKNAMFFLAAGVALYLNLIRRFHRGPPTSFDNQSDDALDGFNNFTGASPEKKPKTGKALESIAKKHALLPYAVEKLRKE